MHKIITSLLPLVLLLGVRLSQQDVIDLKNKDELPLFCPRVNTQIKNREELSGNDVCHRWLNHFRSLKPATPHCTMISQTIDTPQAIHDCNAFQEKHTMIDLIMNKVCDEEGVSFFLEEQSFGSVLLAKRTGGIVHQWTLHDSRGYLEHTVMDTQCNFFVSWYIRVV